MGNCDGKDSTDETTPDHEESRVSPIVLDPLQGIWTVSGVEKCHHYFRKVKPSISRKLFSVYVLEIDKAKFIQRQRSSVYKHVWSEQCHVQKSNIILTVICSTVKC